MVGALQSPSPIAEEAQGIIDNMLSESKPMHTVTTSDRLDWKRHQQFKGVVNELRKRGLKVSSKDYWGETLWTITI